MDRYSELKEKLSDCREITMGNLMLTTSPLLMDAYTDMDCVLLDKEHGILGTEEMVPMTMRCRSLGLPAIVRVEDSLYHLIAKSIDLGADGIMIPRTESIAQVKTAVDAIHFPPIGRTGYGGFGILREGETFDDFQKGRILLLQIESAKGRALVPQMIAEYGDYIDGFVVGPFDYSVTLGVPTQIDHPLLLHEMEQLFDTCRSYGKSCGSYCADAAKAKLYRSMGANIFWLGDDRSYIRTGIRKMISDVFD